MKTTRLLIAATIVLAALPAHAISRYNVQTMTCQRVQGILAQEGAAIFRYPSKRDPSLTLYDRYVLHRGFCQTDEYAANAWIPTSDTAECFVRNCRAADYEDDFFRRD